MRTTLSVMLFVLCLGLTVLFQNCGGNQAMTVNKTLASHAGSTYFSGKSISVDVQGRSQVTVDLGASGIAFQSLTLDITPGTNNPGTFPIFQYTLPSGILALGAGICTGGTDEAGAAFDLFEGGYFLTSAQREIFIQMVGFQGQNDAPVTAYLSILEPKAGVTSAKFRSAVCASFGSMSPSVGAGTTSPSNK